MNQTAFHTPGSVDEAVGLLDRLSGEVRLLAGGTDLVVQLNENRNSAPRHLIYLGGLEELKTLGGNDQGLKLGALVSHARLAQDPLIARAAPLLALAAGRVGGPAIRTVGTIGGNVATASPAGDVSTALLALDARAQARGPEGWRIIPLADLFLAPGRTALWLKELLCSFEVPLQEGPAGQWFEKLGQRRAMSIALVSCAASVRLDPSGRTIASAGIGLGSVAPTPLRAREAEALLQGAEPSPDLFAAAADKAQGECSPIDDIRASAGYRREMVGVLVRRCLDRAVSRARQKGETSPVSKTNPERN